jgi:hypothetical protein
MENSIQKSSIYNIIEGAGYTHAYSFISIHNDIHNCKLKNQEETVKAFNKIDDEYKDNIWRCNRFNAREEFMAGFLRGTAEYFSRNEYENFKLQK